MVDTPQFRASRAPATPEIRGRVASMAFVLVVCVAFLAVRAHLLGSSDAAPPLAVVEVRGAVPQPGFHEADTLHAALQAAGLSTEGRVDAALQPGTRIRVRSDGQLVLEPMDEVLVFGLPIDINRASAQALEAIPGIGPSLAGRIIEDRQRRGPFRTVEDLDRVKGIGPATVEKMRPFVQVSP